MENICLCGLSESHGKHDSEKVGFTCVCGSWDFGFCSLNGPHERRIDPLRPHAFRDDGGQDRRAAAVALAALAEYALMEMR